MHAEEKFAIGNVVTGRVARMADFGAFVELDKGIDALLHVSQISKEHIDKPSDVLKIGDEVTAKIVDFNPENHKISLSIKALKNDEERARREAERANRVEVPNRGGNDDAVAFDIEKYIANQKNEE